MRKTMFLFIVLLMGIQCYAEQSITLFTKFEADTSTGITAKIGDERNSFYFTYETALHKLKLPLGIVPKEQSYILGFMINGIGFEHECIHLIDNRPEKARPVRNRIYVDFWLEDF